MEPSREIAAPHDLSALAWVQEELRKTLETAQRALRRYLREVEASANSDLDDVEPSVLRTARQQLHLGVGALEVVNVPEGAMLLRASENLVQRFVAKPQRLDAAGVEAVERGSFALLDYLGRRLAGRPVDPVGLFPQLRTLLELCGAERIHPADLWSNDWRWRPIPAAMPVRPRVADAAMLAEFEKQLLTLVRTNVPACGLALRKDCSALAAAASGSPEEVVLWRLAAGFFDACAARGIGNDVYVKRTASRVLAQLRSLVKAGAAPDRAVSERLAQDLLFHCSRATCATGAAPCLDVVRRAYELVPSGPDYNELVYGRFDPAWIGQARKRVDSAKDVWSGVAGGEQQRLPGLVETFTLVGESIRKLYTGGDQLSNALLNAAEQTYRHGRPPTAELAMEVATSLLYLEASLEEREFDLPDQGERVIQLAARLDRVGRGQPAEPLEPWMEELYRRVSDRQTMGSVVQELHASLGEVERQIDQYFRNPKETGLLVPVPGQLATMRGVLSVLNIEQAGQAVERMAADVEQLIATELDPHSSQAMGAFQRLAGNLGALGFLIDMLGVQPQLTRLLFVFDAASGVLAPVMGRHAMAPDLIDRAQAIAAAMRRDDMSLEAVANELRALASQPQISTQPALAATLSSAKDALFQVDEAGAGRHTEEAVREHIAQAMDDFVATATSPVGLEAPVVPLISRPMDLNPPAFAATGLEDDQEMREIFLEESREVLALALGALHELEQTPADQTQMITVRRAFHTLKGSSRMVGLSAFGEAAWSCEQLYNRWLAEQTSASAELRTLTSDALHYFAAWVDAIADDRDAPFTAEPVIVAADTLRLAGELMHVHLPGQGSKPGILMDLSDAFGAAGPDGGDLTVDLEVPVNEPAVAVFETLEATRPVDLGPAEGPADSSPMPFPISGLDLLLDLGGPTLAPTLQIEPQAGRFAPAPAPAPAPEAEAEADGAGPHETLPEPERSPVDEFEALGFDVGDVEEIDVDLELAPLHGDDSGVAPIAPPDDQAAAHAAALVPEVLDIAFDTEAPPLPAELPLPADESALQPPESLTAQPEAPVDVPLSFDAVELPSAGVPLDLAANEEPWPTLPDAAPLTRPAELYALHGPDSELPPIVAPSQLAALMDDASQRGEPAEAMSPESRFNLDFGLGLVDTVPQAKPEPVAEHPPDRPLDAGSGPEFEVESWMTPDPGPEVAGLSVQAAASPPLPVPGGAPVLTDDQFKVVGHLRLPIPLFNIYLNEADELSRRLGTELAEWSLELDRPVGEAAIALAHSLAGSSATVGFQDLSQLARELEHALMRSDALGGGEPADAMLFVEASDEIRRLLHQFAAGFLQQPPAGLRQRLQSWEQAMQEKLDDWALHPERAPAIESLPLPLISDEANASVLAELVAEDLMTKPQLDAGLTPLSFAPRARLDVPAVPEDPETLEALEPQAVSELDLTLDDQAGVVGAQAESGSAGSVAPDLDLSTGFGAELGFAEPPVPDEVPVLVDRVLPEAAPASAAVPELHDVVDLDLFPVFQEEAEELLPLLANQVRKWRASPSDVASGTACMRTLHTFKGGARLAGAMQLGDLAHRFETVVEKLLSFGRLDAADVAPLQLHVDQLVALFDSVRSRFAVARATEMVPLPLPSVLAPLSSATDAGTWITRPAPIVDTSAAADDKFRPDPIPGRPSSGVPSTDDLIQPAQIDWTHLASMSQTSAPVVERGTISMQPVRVRAQLLDRLVNLAGEVSITRSRLEAEVNLVRGSLADLTDNLDRLNQQLHDIAMQADTQMESRLEAARAAAQAFDPLEMDRYTRLQELTRMMAESVNDVATVRGTMLRTLQTAEDELAAQARLTRELQSDLLRTRMLEFDSLTERLQRVVRQAAVETSRQVRLDIVGGSIEVDRGVLDRMTAAFEHLLRNCVTHGIEPAEQRVQAGKDPVGSIVIAVEQDGNEVTVELRDDGAGLDLQRIRERAVAMGLLAPDAMVSDKELVPLIFAPGLSTMPALTELAGRGVGMDVVRADVQALGGRIEIHTEAGHGTRFKLVLPLTTVVTQVVMLRAGGTQIAVPSYLIELVQRATPQNIDKAYRQGSYLYGGLAVPFYWLGALLETSGYGNPSSRTQPVVIVRSAQQRVAVHVDEVLGNHEVVVKNLGTQLSRVPGLAGMTLLASGAVALIYNPVALAAVYGDKAQRATQQAFAAPVLPVQSTDHSLAPPAPLVMVVDDSLTVRRVTKRMLEREGYRVALAKDGLEALEVLAGEQPAVVLSDIEMPRMDGFDLLRNIRADAVLADLPVVMITSRIAQKHRELAMRLGANHYLGKPYSEDELLGLISSYVNGQATQPG